MTQPTLPIHEARPEPIVWWQHLPNRNGLASYVHLIRSPLDPKRSPRRARRGQETRWRDLGRIAPEEWADRICALLADGRLRTFNAIAVELADVTANVVAGKSMDRGLWMAVEDGRLEYTEYAPVLWRLREGAP